MGYVIIVAIALLLIIEGFLPFVAPKLWRRMMRNLSEQSDRALHIMGFFFMLVGVAILFISHHYFI